MEKIYHTFYNIADETIDYLSQWYLQTPVVITTERYAQFKTLQQLLYKAICHFITQYEKYDNIFPINKKTKEIIKICQTQTHQYRPGTYRPDFLITNDQNIKICEIGARFPLNGYFMSGFSSYIGETKLSCTPNPDKEKEYERFLKYLFQYWGTFTKLCVLKGNDKPGDIKYYIPYFQKMGIEVTVLTPEEISGNLNKLKNAAVVNEFNQMELEMLSTEVLQAIAASNALNDMRSIFLIHDKRFLAILSQKQFLLEIMSNHEAELLQQYIIPTYTRVQNTEIWEKAKQNKDGWIIKHYLLGKSEKIYAGAFCTQEEWQQLFDSEEIEHMILQPFIKQKTITSKIKQNQYTDYAVGTLLCFDNNFFGPGLFRTSSFEITNRVDDRKMAPWITDNYSETNDIFIL